jgi:hypothetical protein
MDADTLRAWHSAHTGYQCYPSVMPADYAQSLLMANGCDVVGRFFASMRPGITEYFVARKSNTRS